MDVHVKRAVITALRMRGVDVVTAQEDGSARFDDDRLLERATALGCVLVSQDEDLLREANRMLRTSRSFGGLIYAHQLRNTIGQMIEDLELLAKATTEEYWQDRIEFLPLV